MAQQLRLLDMELLAGMKAGERGSRREPSAPVPVTKRPDPAERVASGDGPPSRRSGAGRLDDRTRELGLRGVAEVRRILMEMSSRRTDQGGEEAAA
jgi:hypothetical protein